MEVESESDIDFVLVWDSKNEISVNSIAVARRDTFEHNLKQEGLVLSHEDHTETGLHFVKIGVPQEVLKRYAEILKLRLPMKKFEHIQEVQIHMSSLPIIGDVMKNVQRGISRFTKPFLHDHTKLPPKSTDLTAVFSRDKAYLFDTERPNFFTQSTRSRVIEFILKRKRLSPDALDDSAFGIERALNEGVYTAAYPLHDVSTIRELVTYIAG